MMKKRVLLLVSLILFLIIFLIIDKNRQFGKYEIIFVDEISQNYQDVKICLLNNEDKFEVVNIKVEKEVIKNDFGYLLKMFDEYRNSLPINYRTPLFENIKVLSIKIDNEVMYLEIDKIGAKTDLNSFFTSLIWSYRYLGIKQIELKIGNTKYFLDENTKINPIILSSRPLKTQIYYELTENGFIPYTIYHNNNCLDMILKMSNVNIKDVSYVEKDNSLVIEFFNKINEEKLKEIQYNLNYLNYNDINIIINGK